VYVGKFVEVYIPYLQSRKFGGAKDFLDVLMKGENYRDDGFIAETHH
jgi:hypothetical protein